MYTRHFSSSHTCDIISSGVCMQVPAIMGMLGVWYNNFFGAQSHALLPYDQVISWMNTYTCTCMYIELCMPEPTEQFPLITCTLLPLSHLIFGTCTCRYGWMVLLMLVVHHRCKMFLPFSFHTVSAQVCSLFSAGKTTVIYILHLECMWYI